MRIPLLDTERPIVAAPMAGGPTTVALATAVADAGGFPFLAGGYKTAAGLRDEIVTLRASGAPFGVNLFVPDDTELDRAAFAAYAAELKPEASRHGVSVDSEPVTDDDNWDEKFALLIEQPVPIVSFTFGLPAATDIGALRERGTRVLATVTTPEEAAEATARGVDGLVVQGADAGGHSATFDPGRDPAPLALTELIAGVRKKSKLPLIAAGGITSSDAVREVLAAGAIAAAVGTLLLRTDEAGTSAVHRAALSDPEFDRTVITRAFTGRPARALHNDFIAAHGANAPVAYPAVHHLTRPIRQAATKAGDTQRVHLWAGTGYREAPTGPAANVIHRLWPNE